MRRTYRQLAAVKPSKYVEVGSPTGLTGLFAHPTPRATLCYLYASTLDKLKQFPESSLYRQSTEALTQHRLNIINAIEPVGYKEWEAKAKEIMTQNPEQFTSHANGLDYHRGKHFKVNIDGSTFVKTKFQKEVDVDRDEWDREKNTGLALEPSNSTIEREEQAPWGKVDPEDKAEFIAFDPEPPLTSEQIDEIETKIGAGLIEEVIKVAEGELKLLDILYKAEAWQDLEEKPVEGQWTYFPRDTDTEASQSPPQK